MSLSSLRGKNEGLELSSVMTMSVAIQTPHAISSAGSDLPGKATGYVGRWKALPNSKCPP